MILRDKLKANIEAEIDRFNHTEEILELIPDDVLLLLDEVTRIHPAAYGTRPSLIISTPWQMDRVDKFLGALTSDGFNLIHESYDSQYARRHFYLDRDKERLWYSTVDIHLVVVAEKEHSECEIIPAGKQTYEYEAFKVRCKDKV